jgi:uncharacterized protein (DUF58 family)
MALTGRAGLLALVACLVVLAAPAGGLTVLVVAVALLAGILVDLAFAASPRALALEHGGATSTRLGEPADVTLTVTNTGGRRLRAVVRDAWPPSARAHPRAQWLDVPAGERRRLTTTLAPERRGDRPAAGVTVRSLGPLGLAARQRTRSAPWTVRVLPPFAAAHARRARDGERPRPRHGVRLAAGVRRRRRPALDRLARHRASCRRRRAHLAAGA